MIYINDREYQSDIQSWFHKQPQSFSINYQHIISMDYIYPQKWLKPSIDWYYHFHDVSMIADKAKLYQTLVNYYGQDQLPSFVPKTYVINSNSITNLAKLVKDSNTTRWILKPSQASTRRGVKVVLNWDELCKWINQSKNRGYHTWVVQEYIERPLLIDNQKCHLRVFLILIIRHQTDSIKKLTGYLYDKGFLYFAETPYSEQNGLLSGCGIHKILEYPKDFQPLFGQNAVTKVNDQVKTITQQTSQAFGSHLRSPQPTVNSWALLGYDILINENFDCHLAEINARHVVMPHRPKFRTEAIHHIFDLIFYQQTTNFQPIIDLNLD